MQVRILGPLEVSSDRGVLPVAGQKQRVVLALLTLRLGEVVSVDELIETGWGDQLPADPANALQYQVAQLRKIIEPNAHPQYLVTTSPGYRLDAETVTTDVDEFRKLVSSARQAVDADHLDQAEELINAAMAMWRGPALAEFRYDDFASGDAERLESERIAATELQIDIALATGGHAGVAPRLAQLTIEHPRREGLWARLVLALYRDGQQSAALQVLQDARTALADVGLEPGAELRQLERQVLAQDESLSLRVAPAAATPHNLPAPPNRLIGRDADLHRLVELLDRSRSVTLIGPGGAGKTRLAIAVGAATLDRYPGGVWFAPLDTLDDGSLLPAAIGRVSGMRENPDRPVLDTLAAHLGRKRTLLVLDNCEHLVEAVAPFAEQLTSRCDQLSVLATSQVRLDTVGEVVVTVSPLALPGETASIYDPITDVDAVALFVERAREAGAPVDDWSDDELATIANIVAALDGLPLALELAAARTRSMSLDEIAQGLSDRFTTLSRGPRTAPTRQRSLLGAVEWSMNLLGDRERLMLARLSVLTGGFDVHNAAAVAGETLVTIRDDLALLVDHSLLNRTSDVAGTARFAMLESLRHYGLNTLDPEEYRAARVRHLTYFAEFARVGDEGLRGPDQLDWLHRIDAAYHNIRAALSWSLEGDERAAGILLASRLGRYWDWRGLLKEGAAWTHRLTEHDIGPVAGLASTLAWKSYSAWEYGELDAARKAITLAIEAAQALNDPTETAAALSVEQLISRSLGDLEAARAEGRAFSRAATQAGDPWLTAWSESVLATVEVAAKDLDAAAEHARRSCELFAELGDRRAETWGQISLAQVALDRGNHDEADSRARYALDGAVAVEDDRNALWALELLADVAHRRGDTERSARLWGAAHPLRESRGLAGSVSKQNEPSDLGTVLGEALGAPFASLVDSGRDNPHTVIAEELAQLRPDPSP